jgi:transcriptional regulator of acetoin/glycerol metabolism
VEQGHTHAANVLRLVSGRGTAEFGSISSSIVNSWRRCAFEYSLDPVRPPSPSVVAASVLAEARERHADLLRIASAEIDWLYAYIAQSGYALILTDANGIVLYEKTDAGLAETFHRAGLIIGADWSEHCEGTNGIGTCIAERRSIVVRRDEHFLATHIGLTCFGSPIRDPAGSLVAVLDASTLNAPSSEPGIEHTKALVEMSARVIEKFLFLRHFRDGIVLRFHARPEFVSLQHDGAIALATDATIIAADDTAVRLLGATTPADFIGRRIDDVFDVRADELIDSVCTEHTGLQPIRERRSGRRFFGHIEVGRRISQFPVASPIDLQPQSVMRFPPQRQKTPLTLEEIAGEDPKMLRNVRSARRIASSRVPVMIQGPTGAGKEVFARALHAASDRASMPFVALNCAAIPESLIESELFGYRSGAFTGARREGMKGKILQSSGGTLFLDEIGDMPLALQTRLLRVLEEHEVVPLGTEVPIKVDLRVICASHRNLREMISRGEFREDLYYRLNGITLELPPLAERTDKERLIREFLSSETTDGRPAAIETAAFQRLNEYRWPGNIRELRNVIRTALAICEGGVVRLDDLPREVREACPPEADVAAPSCVVPQPEQPEMPSVAEPMPEQAEREKLLQLIDSCAGNMSLVAQRLGISRNTLYRHCKQLGIPPRQRRPLV